MAHLELLSDMDTGVEVAIVSASASIIVAAASFVFNARQKRADELRQLKIARYTELLAAISDLAVYGLNDKTQARYAAAFNSIALTAPQNVMKALFDFEDEINISNEKPSSQRQDELFSQLIFEIRLSLELPLEDESRTFRYRIMGGLSEPR